MSPQKQMGMLYISGEFRLEQLRFSLLLCSKYFPVVAFVVSNAAIKQIQNINGPRRDKTCLQGFRQSEIQISLLSYRD